MQIAYFDESGNHTDADIFAVGGCVATQAAWGAFQNEWQEVLRAGGVRYFHMSEYESRVRQFDGWEDERRVPFLRRLHAVFAEHVGAGVGRAVLKTAYQKIVEREAGLLRGTRLQSFPPYLFCLQACLDWIVEACPDPEGDPLMVVCEVNPTMEGRTREYFDAVRRQAKIVEVRFGAKIEHAGLQAADMMAYETYKHISKEYEGRMLPIDDRRPDRRWLINLVGSRRISMEYFGPTKLAAVVARMGNQRASGTPGSAE